jgi:hypothetical protein
MWYEAVASDDAVTVTVACPVDWESDFGSDVLIVTVICAPESVLTICGGVAPVFSLVTFVSASVVVSASLVTGLGDPVFLGLQYSS